MEHEGDNYTHRVWCFCYGHQRIINGTGSLGNERTNRDHPKFFPLMNGQNIETSPEELRRLTITQTPVKDY